ncbi:serine/threonine-protein kinase TOR isoform X2 [Tanacetum coccineum]
MNILIHVSKSPNVKLTHVGLEHENMLVAYVFLCLLAASYSQEHLKGHNWLKGLYFPRLLIEASLAVDGNMVTLVSVCGEVNGFDSLLVLGEADDCWPRRVNATCLAIAAMNEGSGTALCQVVGGYPRRGNDWLPVAVYEGMEPIRMDTCPRTASNQVRIREKSAVSHVVTLHHHIAAKLTEISGTIAFAISGTPADCTSLGISKALFPREPDVITLNQEHKHMLSIAPAYDHLPLIAKVGYLFGLGDRHPSNLMLHRFSGKILHIDYGDCFEAPINREKFPEKVPFCNEGRGYVLQRILRRALLYGRKVLRAKPKILNGLPEVVVNLMRNVFLELKQQEAHIREIIAEEEASFKKILHHGFAKFRRMVKDDHRKIISGQARFLFYNKLDST